eukprot:9109816-Pyramimonas_sp.AAC.1
MLRSGTLHGDWSRARAIPERIPIGPPSSPGPHSVPQHGAPALAGRGSWVPSGPEVSAARPWPSSSGRRDAGTLQSNNSVGTRALSVPDRAPPGLTRVHSGRQECLLPKQEI